MKGLIPVDGETTFHWYALYFNRDINFSEIFMVKHNLAFCKVPCKIAAKIRLEQISQNESTPWIYCIENALDDKLRSNS